MAAWSGFWGDNNAITGSYSLQNNRPSLHRRIARIMRANSARWTKAVALALNGAAAGDTATSTYKRREAPSDANSLGGVAVIETVTVVDAATTAGNETTIDTVWNSDSAPASYPTDASGNGGGGKVGV